MTGAEFPVINVGVQTGQQIREQTLKQMYGLGKSLLDLVVQFVRNPCESQNQYISKIAKSEIAGNNSFVGITGKYLTDIDIVDPLDGRSQSAITNCTLLRFVMQNPQQHLYLNSPMADGTTGKQVRIVKMF